MGDPRGEYRQLVAYHDGESSTTLGNNLVPVLR